MLWLATALPNSGLFDGTAAATVIHRFDMELLLSFCLQTIANLKSNWFW